MKKSNLDMKILEVFIFAKPEIASDRLRFWLALSCFSKTHQKKPVVGRTTLQSMMNAKLSLHGFWHCHKNGLIKTIQTIPHNLYVSFKLTFLYCGLRLILVYPNPQQREADLTLTYRLWGIVWIVLMSPFSWQCQNLSIMCLTFMENCVVLLVWFYECWL